MRIRPQDVQEPKDAGCGDDTRRRRDVKGRAGAPDPTVVEVPDLPDPEPADPPATNDSPPADSGAGYSTVSYDSHSGGSGGSADSGASSATDSGF